MATYRVGYCKPPKDKQFRKGVSGNPNGRPKGAPNMPKILQKTLSESVEIIEGGKPKTISKMEAATRRLVDQAIAGDMHAFRVLSALMQIARDPAEIHPPLVEGGPYSFAPDPQWCRIVEFYCPECAVLLEVEYLPPGHPLTHDIELDIDSMKARAGLEARP